jgi:hypothetical protein
MHAPVHHDRMIEMIVAQKEYYLADKNEFVVGSSPVNVHQRDL